jgi:hypothetical protein
MLTFADDLYHVIDGSAIDLNKILMKDLNESIVGIILPT